VLFVSGHTGFGTGQDDPSYLSAPDDAGPAIVADLQASGFTVSVDYFVDQPQTDANYYGYDALLAVMDFVRTTWQPSGTRTVVIAHSHGGVWAHEAIRASPGLHVTALVDLDCSSYLWGTAHLFDVTPFGDPTEWYPVGYYLTYPTYPTAPYETTGVYDTEDLVFPNVARNLEVRSGAAPLGGEWFDETWNIRTDGTGTGITVYVSFTSHSEVHEASGSTLVFVRSWLLDSLGE
jgi:hypothetical protein